MNYKKIMCLSMTIIALGVVGTGCNGGTNNTPTTTVTTQSVTENLTYDGVVEQLMEIDRQQQELDNQEDALKASYRSGQMSRDEYLAQIASIDNKKVELDRRENELELQLEALKGGNVTGTTAAFTPPTTSAPTTSATTTPATSANSASSAEIDKIIKELAELDIKDEELDYKEDQLEYQYRTGQIDRTAFNNGIADIQRQELEIDTRQNELELQLFNLQASAYTGATTAPGATTRGGGSYENLINNERQQQEVELQEDQLELQYRQGQITYEEFRKKMIELEAREDTLDYEEDMLEGDWD